MSSETEKRNSNVSRFILGGNKAPLKEYTVSLTKKESAVSPENHEKYKTDQETVECDNSEEKDAESSNEVLDRAKKLRGRPKRNRVVESDSKGSNTISSQEEEKEVPQKKFRSSSKDNTPTKVDISAKQPIAENYALQLRKEGVERKKRPAMLNLPDNFFDIAKEEMHSVREKDSPFAISVTSGIIQRQNIFNLDNFVVPETDLCLNRDGPSTIANFPLHHVQQHASYGLDRIEKTLSFEISSSVSLVVKETADSLAHVKLNIVQKGVSIEFDVDYSLFVRSISTDLMKPIIKVPRMSWNTLIPNLLSDIEVYAILAQLSLYGKLYQNRTGIIGSTSKIHFEPGKLNSRNHMFQISDTFMFITIDTCVLMENIKTVEFLLNTSPLKGGLSPVLIVPWVVTQELDGLKKSSVSDKAFRARCAVRFIHKYLTLKHPRLIIQNAREANRIRNNEHTKNDDRLLDICLDLINNLGVKHSQVYLFTFDENLENKAMANELKLLTFQKINEFK